LSDAIAQAYRVQYGQISGAAWLDTERFDIAAKIPAGVAMDQIPRMLQALLADRFKLQLHRENKKLPIYALVVDKNGLKLQKAESPGGVSAGFNPGRAHMSGRFSMPQLADYLSHRLGRPVLDQTGLDGAYAIALEWVPDPTDEPGSAPVTPPAAGEGTSVASGPSIFTALREQLGLTLAAMKGPVEILVIDHAEKVPTEN
jgi:uncharacterized protein (TIGR03435 family)